MYKRQVLWTVHLIVQLCTVDYNYLINRVDLFMNTLISITTIYYQIMFNVRQDQSSNYIANIVYIDQSLQSLHIQVPHTQNGIVCVLFIVIIFYLFFYVILSYENLKYVNFLSMTLDFTKLYKVVCLVTVCVLFLMQYVFCFYIMNVIRQRVQLTRRAVERLSLIHI